MEKRTLDIHSKNILPIIKQWLYSDREIFLRELVSNATDACQKMNIISQEKETFTIKITPNKEKKTLTISDNGIGMDKEEVIKYIAQIAYSSAEEFVEKYEGAKEAIIGHFGLGFYSAFMVADQVVLDTLSYKPGARSVRWSSDGSSEYTLEEGEQKTRGTTITLHIADGDEEYLEEAKLRELLEKHSAFLPFPIFLNDTQINTHEPLWIRPPSQCEDKDYIDFYRYLYPFSEDPLFWIHLNVDYPFNLKGILYFPKLKKDFDPKKHTVKLFCNRVFVSDSCKDVLPNYLMALQGVIDSPDIPLNVSRSTLQMDKTVRQLASHISKKVSDSLSTLYKTDKEKYLTAWKDISLFLKVGVLEDEKFYERTKELLLWKSDSGAWMTAEDYLEKNREKTKDAILYVRDEKPLSHFHDIYKEKGIDILFCKDPIDPYLFQFLEGKLAPAKFQRLDSRVDEHVIDATREKKILDSEGKTEAGRLAELIKSNLSDENVEVEAKSLVKDALPGFVVMNENERRMRDWLETMEPEKDARAFGKKTFIVNTNNPLVAAISKLQAKDASLAKELSHAIYDISLLSQREMSPKDLNGYIERSLKVLEDLATKAARG